MLKQLLFYLYSVVKFSWEWLGNISKRFLTRALKVRNTFINIIIIVSSKYEYISHRYDECIAKNYLARLCSMLRYPIPQVWIDNSVWGKTTTLAIIFANSYDRVVSYTAYWSLDSISSLNHSGGFLSNLNPMGSSCFSKKSYYYGIGESFKYMLQAEQFNTI